MIITDYLDVLKKHNISYDFIGDSGDFVEGFSSIYQYKLGTMTWIRNMDNFHRANINNTSTIQLIITPKDVSEVNFFRNQIIVDDPRMAFFIIVEDIFGESIQPGIGKNTEIMQGAIIGKNVSIGTNCVISSQTIIGDNCIIGDRVVLKGRVVIGESCIIQSGAIIGEDGYAFLHDSSNNLRQIPHYGGVSIGNHVRIGSNTCVVRGTIDDTTIHNYVKIDNLCHIAHNVIVGENTQIIALTIIMGSVRVGKYCWISTSMIRDQVTIGDNVTVGLGAVVTKDVPDNWTVIGNPAHKLIRKDK